MKHEQEYDSLAHTARIVDAIFSDENEGAPDIDRMANSLVALTNAVAATLKAVQGGHTNKHMADLFTEGLEAVMGRTPGASVIIEKWAQA